ncbi:hypothetical protein SAMN05421839_1015 [Halolactibacillus halophilus]|uniref:Uncharacterized protein n=1 Tax=Halolactibacillus halophilus TaxID=306540 RepID=A0A1I5KT78_9BACI|nr:hypothetical protein HHA03_00030 [Halolactibacillus halophilus]SFO87601.1 hypothetical protein SAMN05421839_1015 [Halolactibacillus halophilus]
MYLAIFSENLYNNSDNLMFWEGVKDSDSYLFSGFYGQWENNGW